MSQMAIIADTVFVDSTTQTGTIFCSECSVDVHENVGMSDLLTVTITDVQGDESRIYH
ncbi:MAG: hypothetical protein KAJ12_08410 [Bacteroidetes bacterium]|nr:hypothetical protein [Bacteroidota bacterium]